MLYRAGRASLSLKKIEQAERYLKRAFHLDPHEKEVMRAL
jgi:hypothetical protein